jgi:CDP-diglyceride synthetase
VARVVSGVLLAAAFFALVWFSNAVVLLFVALAVGVLALHEYTELMRQLAVQIPRIPTVVALLATIAVVPFPYVAGEPVIGIGVVVIAAGAMLQLARQAGTTTGIGVQGPGFSGTTPSATSVSSGNSSTRALFSPHVLGAAAGAFAIIYIGIPLGALVGVHVFGGRGAVLLLVFTIVVSDSAQHYAGRTFGRRQLAPRLSPKKTVEGAIGGFIAAPIFLYFAGPYLVPVVTPLMIAPLGLVLVACGIAGDLFESMIKRAADIKDSSALIPGHGGVLDRIDALLFATPPFYMFLRWVYTV